MGRVQGIFFRDFTKRTADSLDLVGKVSNQWDGSVEVVAQGDEEALQQFVEKLKEGPRVARVDDMDLEWKDELSKEYNRFSIAG